MIKTLSIPAELEDFLKENPDLSPSKMLQSKIIEIRENRKINFVEKARLQKLMKLLQDKLWNANDEIVVLKKTNAELVQQKNQH